MDENYIYNTPQYLIELLQRVSGEYSHADIEHPYTIKQTNFQDMFTIRRVASRLGLELTAEVDERYPLPDGQVFHVIVKGEIPKLIAYIRQVAWAGIAPTSIRETSRERSAL